MVAKDTDFGVSYGGHRPGDKGKTYWRMAHFLFPFWTLPPVGPIEGYCVTRAWVPMDDEHHMVVNFFKKAPLDAGRMAPDRWFAGASNNYRYLPRSTDWYGRFRRADNVSNDYNINRDLQRAGVSYTGIDGIQLQDQAVQESMGGITDHTFERLSPSDLMITHVRRSLIRAARAYKKDGKLPKSASDHMTVAGVRGGHFQAKKSLDWQKAYKAQLKAAPWPQGMSRAAE
jgi:hypothetical protein